MPAVCFPPADASAAAKGGGGNGTAAGTVGIGNTWNTSWPSASGSSGAIPTDAAGSASGGTSSVSSRNATADTAARAPSTASWADFGAFGKGDSYPPPSPVLVPSVLDAHLSGARPGDAAVALVSTTSQRIKKLAEAFSTGDDPNPAFGRGAHFSTSTPVAGVAAVTENSARGDASAESMEMALNSKAGQGAAEEGVVPGTPVEGAIPETLPNSPTMDGDIIPAWQASSPPQEVVIDATRQPTHGNTAESSKDASASGIDPGLEGAVVAGAVAPTGWEASFPATELLRTPLSGGDVKGIDASAAGETSTTTAAASSAVETLEAALALPEVGSPDECAPSTAKSEEGSGEGLAAGASFLESALEHPANDVADGTAGVEDDVGNELSASSSNPSANATGAAAENAESSEKSNDELVSTMEDAASVRMPDDGTEEGQAAHEFTPGTPSLPSMEELEVNKPNLAPALPASSAGLELDSMQMPPTAWMPTEPASVEELRAIDTVHVPEAGSAEAASTTPLSVFGGDSTCTKRASEVWPESVGAVRELQLGEASDVEILPGMGVEVAASSATGAAKMNDVRFTLQGSGMDERPGEGVPTENMPVEERNGESSTEHSAEKSRERFEDLSIAARLIGPEATLALPQEATRVMGTDDGSAAVDRVSHEPAGPERVGATSENVASGSGKHCQGSAAGNDESESEKLDEHQRTKSDENRSTTIRPEVLRSRSFSTANSELSVVSNVDLDSAAASAAAAAAGLVQQDGSCRSSGLTDPSAPPESATSPRTDASSPQNEAAQIMAGGCSDGGESRRDEYGLVERSTVGGVNGGSSLDGGIDPRSSVVNSFTPEPAAPDTTNDPRATARPASSVLPKENSEETRNPRGPTEPLQQQAEKYQRASDNAQQPDEVEKVETGADIDQPSGSDPSVPTTVAAPTSSPIAVVEQVIVLAGPEVVLTPKEAAEAHVRSPLLSSNPRFTSIPSSATVITGSVKNVAVADCWEAGQTTR